MKIDHRTTRAIACCMYLILLSIVAAAVFYELTVDWGNISSVLLGLYLFSVYLLLGILMEKPENRIGCFQRRSTEAFTSSMP